MPVCCIPARKPRLNNFGIATGSKQCVPAAVSQYASSGDRNYSAQPRRFRRAPGFYQCVPAAVSQYPSSGDRNYSAQPRRFPRRRGCGLFLLLPLLPFRKPRLNIIGVATVTTPIIQIARGGPTTVISWSEKSLAPSSGDGCPLKAATCLKKSSILPAG